MKVWVAYARIDSDTEDHDVGLFTSRRKAKRAVLEYFELERGKWQAPNAGTTYEPLDYEWLQEKIGDLAPSGAVMQREVH